MIDDPEVEECARCGLDHGLQPEQAQLVHSRCSMCQEEMRTGAIGEGPDHRCEDVLEPEQVPCSRS
jgi:hypothetical protein